MKNITFFKVLALPFLAALLFLTSCNKDEAVPSATDHLLEIADNTSGETLSEQSIDNGWEERVSSQNSVLIFENREDFTIASTALREMELEDAEAFGENRALFHNRFFLTKY